MEIRQSNDNGVAVLVLNGRLDELSAPELERVAAPLFGLSSPRVLVDMAGVEYVSSGGLRVILLLLKGVQRADGTLRLCGLNSFVTEVFSISNMLPLFELYDTQEEAFGTF